MELDQSSYQYTQELLDQLSREIHSLKERMEALEQQNEQLKQRLKKLRDGQTDMFSSLTEKERISYRHRIQQLISKIDEHLDNHS